MNRIQVVLDKVLPKNVDFKKHSAILFTFIVVGAFVSFYGVPKMVTTIVRYMAILKSGRFIRQKHENKLPFTYKLYLWNVTNPDQVIAGTEKPKMQEIGPYVFSQFKQKVNVTDNTTEDTMSFDLWNIYHFNPQLSAPLTGDEMVTLVDAVTVAAATKIYLERPNQLNILIEAMDILFNKTSSIFMTMKAIDFIDKGYEIHCVHKEYAAKVACAEFRKAKMLKIVNQEKTFLRYRWFDKRNNTIQARYSVLRGVKNVHDIGRVTTVNDKPTMGLYKQNERCDLINGTDKLFFPPFQKKSDLVVAYSFDACKNFPVRHEYTESIRGAKASWKSLDMKDPLFDPACECDKYVGCVPRGTLNMYACLDIFLLGSLPHFHTAEPSILTTLEGMNPKEHLHKTGIYFDLLTGSPILTLERFQVSWLLKRIPEYPIFSSVAVDVWIPVFWYEESFSIQKSDLALIIFSRISKIFGVATGYILMSTGFMGLIALALHFNYRTPVTQEAVTEMQNNLQDTN